MNSREYNTVLFEFSGGIGHIIMNQPPANMMTVEFFNELGDLVSELKRMNGLKAIVISGMGRHFSAGAQLEQLTGMMKTGENRKTGDLPDFLMKNIDTFLFFLNLNIPVISAIRGVCFGSALELAMFTHYRFCGEDAIFGLPETTFDLIPGIGGISRLAMLTGRAKALELVLRGNIFPAEVALRINLVDKILPKKQVVNKAVDFAGSVMNGYRRGKEKLYIQKVKICYV